MRILTPSVSEGTSITKVPSLTLRVRMATSGASHTSGRGL